MRALHRAIACAAIVLVTSASSAFAQAEFTNMIDHIHLAAPDQPRPWIGMRSISADRKHLKGPERLMFGDTRIIFQRSATAKPSMGSAVDHIGFSVPDLDATMKGLEADGAKISAPARDVPGLFKLAFVEDPWGVRIEVVQDAAKLGVHHIHLRAPDPGAVLKWYADTFGGTIGKLKDRIDGISYGGIWVLAQKGDTEPTAGHAIDHLGFRPVNVDAAVEALKAKNVKVTTEPRPLKLASGVTMRLAFIEGPEGVRIELVQR
jgi:catechol 2,3-dioxygenase-like lactoylglutathione lyase family enzyme